MQLNNSGKTRIACTAGRIGLFFGAAGLLLRAAARMLPRAAELHRTYINAFWVNTLGRLFSPVPFSVAEMLIYAGIVFVLLWLVGLLSQLVRKLFRKPDRFCGILKNGLSMVLLLAGVIFYLYESGEDAEFFTQPMTEKYELFRGSYTTEELAEVCRKTVLLCNEEAEKVSRDERGLMVTDERAGDRARRALSALQEHFPEYKGYIPRPKPVQFSALMSYTGLAGIWTAFTEEANYNRDMTAYNIPFTMCHELSHAKGILPENEANFFAWLACSLAEDADFRYSAAMTAWVYCGNELYKRDQALWKELGRELDERVQKDLLANNAFWKQYEGKTMERAESLNDAYLKGKGIESGSGSYEEVVDLLVTWEMRTAEP